MALLPTSPLHLLSLILIYVSVTSSGITGAPLSEQSQPRFESDAAAQLPEKRLSISQELGALADRYNSDSKTQQLKDAESLLISLGKRVPTISLNQELRGLAEQYDKQRAHSAQANLLSLGKRSQDRDSQKSKRVPVSINQSLGPLSSMMREQGAADAQHMLASLGKRSGLNLYPAPRYYSGSDLIGQRDYDVKRVPLSIGQELRLMGDGGRTENAVSFLRELGKRDAAAAAAATDDEVATVKRSPLSVSVPLNAISGMLVEQRRKDSARDAISAQQQLNALG